MIVFFGSVFGGSRTGPLMALDITAVYLMFSLVIGFPGWILVGVPVALFWPIRQLRNLPYYAVLLFGVAAGPVIVFIVLMGDALAHREAVSHYFSNSGLFFVCAAIVAAVCCVVYKLLLRPRPMAALPLPSGFGAENL